MTTMPLQDMKDHYKKRRGCPLMMVSGLLGLIIVVTLLVIII